MAPAGMLNELSRDLQVSIGQASLLVTLGAVVLCLGSPLLSWATSRMDRRTLLCAILLIITAAHLAAAFTTSFAAVLALRLVMLAAAAPFTPQAAGVVGLIVPVERRASAIAYVFLGWSLAAAVGLPLMTAIASRLGWPFCFVLIAVVAALSTALLAWRMPARLHTPAVDLKAWGELFRNRLVLLLLVVTVLQIGGQFVLFTFIGPLLAAQTGAGPDAIGLAFALYGIAGFLGNLAATQVVGRLGTVPTSLLATGSVALGIGDLGCRRRVLPGDGDRHLHLGARLCGHELDAAGAACRSCSSAGRLGRLAEYVGPLYRPGARLRTWQCAVRPCALSADGLCGVRHHGRGGGADRPLPAAKLAVCPNQRTWTGGFPPAKVHFNIQSD